MSEGRLVIRNLELHNFKSYSGTHIVGPFDSSFTSVIGPNGCGKSNVIDALLFVFGKRARKLRMNRLSELIHQSAHSNNHSFAKVTIHFHSVLDNETGGSEVIAGSEFSIGRIANVNNKTDYLLNDVPTRFGELAALMKSKGVDLDNNRFLILQGEVELISQMKPKGTHPGEVGLLEYLEEIIGSDRYIESAQQLSEKLEKANSEKESMERRMKSVENELERLEERKEDAEQFLQQKAECIDLKLQKNACQVLQFKKQLFDLEKRASELDQQRSESNPIANQLHAELTKYRRDIEALQISINHIQRESEAMSRQLSEAECRETGLNTEIRHLNSEQQKNEKKMSSIQEEIQKASEVSNLARAEIEKIEGAIQSMNVNLNTQKQKLEGLMEQYRDELNSFEAQLTEARHTAGPFRERLNEIETSIELKETQKQALTEELLQPQREAEGIQNILDQKQNFHQQTLQLIQEQYQKRNQDSEPLKACEETVQREVLKIEKLEEALEEAEATLNAAKQVSASLSHQNEKMKLLNDARTSGKIPGILGRLGDLGFINAKYDVAISSVCGALEFIVVETAESGEAAGQLLRQKKMSPSTFLFLDKQARFLQHLKNPSQAPRGSERLFDLIEIPDERLKVAFYFALMDTLVVNTLDDGKRIHFENPTKRYTIVTLAGEVITNVGTYTGGGTKRRGRMRLGTSAANALMDPTDAAQKEADASKQKSRIRHDLEAAKRNWCRTKERCERMKAEVDRRGMEIRRLETKKQQEEHDIQVLFQKLQEKQMIIRGNAARASELNVLQRAIEDMKKELENVRSAGREQLEAVRRIEESAENVGNGAIKRQTQYIHQITAEIREKTTHISMHRTSIEEAPGKLQQLEQKRREFVEKLRRAEASLQGMQQTAAALRNEVQQKQNQRNDLENRIREYQNQLDDLNQHLEAKEEAYSEIQERGDSIQIQTEQIQNNQNESRRKIEELEAEANLFKEQFVECLPDEEVPEYREEDVQHLDIRSVSHQIEEFSAELEQADVNLTSVFQYREKKQELDEKKAQWNHLDEQRRRVSEMYEKTKEARLTEFLTGFQEIKSQLKRVYRSITNGGDADLELVDSFDPFSEGMDFSVRPPNKNWKKISNLSGGEKTLSSLSLIFALHSYRPTPLYVMDEIDAALDIRNVAIVANYIAHRTKNGQFIVISLRDQMFDRASKLVGIYKLQDRSHSLTVDVKKYQIPQAEQRISEVVSADGMEWDMSENDAEH